MIQKMINNTYELWDALETIHEAVLGPVSQACAMGEISPRLLALSLSAAGEVERTYELPERLLQVFFGGEEGKQMFSAFLRDVFAPDGRLRTNVPEICPDVLVQVNEAWMVEHGSAQDLDVQPSKHPNRIECLMISLHTEHGTVMVMHPILSKPERHVDRRPFPQRGADSLKNCQGRLTVQGSVGSYERPVH
jgi:hypothetical protein